MAVPKQRNSRKETAGIKAGETPECWQDKPAKRRQKDVEARWTKKHGRSHYGYKNHVNVDRRHKLVRRYQVSGGDATVVLAISWMGTTRLWVCGRIIARRRSRRRFRIHRKASRNKPLSERRSKATRPVRRFGSASSMFSGPTDMGGTLLRRKGSDRAEEPRLNMRRLVQLDRLTAAV